jgi:hypothetical protein
LGPSAAAARAAQQQQQQEHDPDSLQQDDSEASAATAAAGAGGGAARFQAIRAAGAVLEELLTDAWADEDVISAFDKLQPAAVPTYVRLSKTPPQQQQQQPAGQGPGAGAQRQAPVEAALRDQNFQSFAEYVLDNALLGSLQEGGVAAAVTQGEV